MWSNNVVLVLATLCLLSLAPQLTRALSCPCYDPKINFNCTDPGECEFGVVRDPCGCCDICGSGPEETCGLNIPECGTELFCDLQGDELYGKCAWKKAKNEDE